MARLRTLKPEFFTHESLCELSPLHRLLYEGLWCYADREGRLEDRPRYLKTVILPYDQADIGSMLDDLAGRGFIVRYESGGTHCIAIPAFLRHQKPHPKERPTELPPPPVGASKLGPRLATPAQGVAITHAAEMPGKDQTKPRKSTVEPRKDLAEPGKDLVEPGGLGDLCLSDLGLGDFGDGDTSPADAGSLPPDVQLQDLWNKNAHPSLPRWIETPDTRKKRAKKALKERTLLSWLAVIQRINQSHFCLGAKGWAADVDWMLQPGVATKVLEGKYDNRSGPAPPKDVRKGVARAEDQDHSRNIEDAHGNIQL